MTNTLTLIKELDSPTSPIAKKKLKPRRQRRAETRTVAKSQNKNGWTPLPCSNERFSGRSQDDGTQPKSKKINQFKINNSQPGNKE